MNNEWLQEVHTTLGQVASQQSIINDPMQRLLDEYPRHTQVIARKMVTPFGTYLMGVEVKSTQVEGL